MALAFPIWFDAPHRDDEPAQRRVRLDTSASGAVLATDHPDRALVEAVRAGDATTFEKLYMTHAAALHTFVQGYVSADVADDVVQDVFLTLWRRRETVVIQQSIRAYLFGAARLRALQLRRNMRTAATFMERDAREAALRAPNDATPDPAEVAEVRMAVAQALAMIPGRTRELLALRWVHGLSYAESAAVLGVSVEAAKKLGRRAEVTLLPLLERFRG